jgi:hypothetical protein
MRVVARQRDGRCGVVVVVRAGAVERQRRKFVVFVREQGSWRPLPRAMGVG